jgi:galactokinase
LVYDKKSAHNKEMERQEKMREEVEELEEAPKAIAQSNKKIQAWKNAKNNVASQKDDYLKDREELAKQMKHMTNPINKTHRVKNALKLRGIGTHGQSNLPEAVEPINEDDEHFDNGYEHGRSAANDAGFKEKARSIKKDMLADNPHKKGTPAHQAWHQGASEGHQDALDLDM